VKPITIQVLVDIVSLAFSDHPSDIIQAISNMTIITFFYLLRSVEYTCTTSDNADFRLCNIHMWIDNLVVPVMMVPVAHLLASTSSSLVFTTQKNGVQGELVNHACSGPMHCFPIMPLVL
jgi:TRAP-type C4-dicarboxylate transport system permease small subunit